MSSTIRSLVIKVGADLTEAQKGLSQFSRDLGKTGKQLSNAGSSMTKAITVPVLAAGAAIGALVVKAAATGDEIKTMSTQMGLSTSQFQKLKYASNFVDVSLEDMAKGMSKVVKEMGAANESGADYVEIADGVRVSTRGANGELKDSEAMFYDVVDAIGNMTSETEKEIAAQEIFGRSYQDLAPLIDAGSEALKAYGDEAERVGAVIDDETLDSMNGMQDTLDRLKAVLTTVTAKVGAAFIPVLEKLAPVIETSIVPLIQKLAEGLVTIIDAFTALSPETQKFIGILTLMAVSIGPILSGLGSMFTTISSLTSVVALAASPTGIIVLGLVAVAAAVLLIATNWDTIRASAATACNAIVKGINDVFGTTIAYVKWGNAQSMTTHNEFENGREGGGSSGANNKFADESFAGRTKYLDPAGIVKPNARGAEYAQGTNYVPETGYALLHKGEAVIPADMNGASGINIIVTGNTIANDYDIDRIGNELVRKLKLEGVKI